MKLHQFISKVILSEPIEEDSYLQKIPSVTYLQKHGSLQITYPVTIFVGENGTGKSTLIEAIAVAYGFNPEGGSMNFNFHTSDSHSKLWEKLLLTKNSFPKDGFFLRAESFYNMASYIDDIQAERNYGNNSLHNQSHGESFLAVVQNRFRGNGLYILDEPEAALSPMRLLTLMAEIDNLVKQNSQFIIATHSPILMAFPNAEILELSKVGIQSVNYKDTEHYQLTRSFLENPERMLRYLLEDIK